MPELYGIVTDKDNRFLEGCVSNYFYSIGWLVCDNRHMPLALRGHEIWI